METCESEKKRIGTGDRKAHERGYDAKDSAKYL
jgi:hypothetical protein